MTQPHSLSGKYRASVYPYRVESYISQHPPCFRNSDHHHNIPNSESASPPKTIRASIFDIQGRPLHRNHNHKLPSPSLRRTLPEHLFAAPDEHRSEAEVHTPIATATMQHTIHPLKRIVENLPGTTRGSSIHAVQNLHAQQGRADSPTLPRIPVVHTVLAPDLSPIAVTSVHLLEDFQTRSLDDIAAQAILHPPCALRVAIVHDHDVQNKKSFSGVVERGSQSRYGSDMAALTEAKDTLVGKLPDQECEKAAAGEDVWMHVANEFTPACERHARAFERRVR